MLNYLCIFGLSGPNSHPRWAAAQSENTDVLVWNDYTHKKVLGVKGWTVGRLDKEVKSHRAAKRGGFDRVYATLMLTGGEGENDTLGKV